MNAALEPKRKASSKPGVTSAVPSAVVQRKCPCGGSEKPRDDCETCAKAGLSVQRAAQDSRSELRNSNVSSTVNDVLRSSGRPLDDSARMFMESRFGHSVDPARLGTTELPAKHGFSVSEPHDSSEREADRVAKDVMCPPATSETSNDRSLPAAFDFTRVRIHDDSQAADSAQALHASAYTVGDHIVFGSGQYVPHSNTGRALLAHELTHVVQQNQPMSAARHVQRMDWGPLGGKCCNESPEGDEWALVGDGTWEKLSKGDCTGMMTDADGMTCGGGFYQVGNLEGGVCKTPRVDSPAFREKRWTPTSAGSAAKSPTQRGSRQGDTPPGYHYDAAAASPAKEKVTVNVTNVNGAPTITHETKLSAPDGSAKTRTNVGVGEKVTFTGSASGKWTAGLGKPLTQASGATFDWIAPNRAADVTVKLEVGGKTVDETMKVLEPESITATKNREIAIPAGTAGAGMKLTFNYHPNKVSFGNAEAKEVSGPASNVTGYFRKHFTDAQLKHNSGDTFTAIKEDNKDSAEDTAAATLPIKPWEGGTVDWVIPNNFRLNGDAGDGKELPNKVTQSFAIEATGKVTISKGGASVERSP